MFVRSMSVGLILLSAAVAPALGQATWSDNISLATKRAKADGKDLLLNFTGSDWCHWCHVLEKEVFDTRLFKETAPKDFVLVTLDFPVDEAKQNPRLAKQNHEWLERLGVGGFPTIALCDSQGRPYAMLGYQKGGPKPYMESLSRAAESRRKRDRLLAEARKLKGVEKAQKLDEALSQIDPVLVARSYKLTVDEILTLAPADGSLTKKYNRLKLIARLHAAMAELDELALVKDGEKIKARLAEAAKLFRDDSEEKVRFELRRLDVLTEAGLHDEAIDFAGKMVAKAPKSFEAEMARETILENLLHLKKFEQVLKSVAEWTRETTAFEAFSLRVYKVDALRLLDRKIESESLAAELMRDAKKNAELRESDGYDWLQQVAKSNGPGPTYLEFLNDDGEAVEVSEFWIGVAVEPVENGLRVLEVMPKSPAAKSGIRKNDVLIRFNGTELSSVADLVSTIAEAGGQELTVELSRDNAPLEKTILPTKRPEETVATELELGPVPDSWQKDFDVAVTLAKEEGKELVVFFSARWCGPCQVMLSETIPDPKIKAVLRNRVVVYLDLDTKDGGRVARDFAVEAIPAYLFIDAEKKELGRALGFQNVNAFLKTLQDRGAVGGFDAVDVNGDGQLQLREFRRYGSEEFGEGVPLRKMFRRIDKNDDGSLSPEEFENRRSVIEKFVEKSATEAYPDPGRDFVLYPGGAAAVDDAKVFGALVHRYQEMLASNSVWPEIDPAKVPASIARPELSTARECRTATDLARASLIVAGGDEADGGFFTSGAVLVSAGGLALTNYHVIEDIGTSKMIAMGADGKVHRIVEVLAGNKERDVALIRIEGDGFHAVKIATKAPVAGDDLVMMHHSEMRFFTYDRGYVMRYSQIASHPWMEVSAEYAPGGSGCGLFNRQHELVGLVSSITMGDGPDLAADDSLENEESELEEFGDEDPVTFGALVVKHAVPWSAINSLWKK